MPRYRLTYREKPVGEWRETRLQALADAVDLKLGSRDEHVPDRIYTEPFVGVEVKG